MAIAGSLTYDTKLDTKGFDSGISEINKKTDKLQSAMSTIGGGFKKAFELATVAVGATATTLVGLGTSATKSFANLEQNLGGVETLFKDNGTSVEKLAEKYNITTQEAQKMYDTMSKEGTNVIENANKAFETAGMSANEYMETVTGISASLLQGLNGDTAKAAKIADTAIIDMSDNANKMGTSMESIQFAYQGFAKQNYTMLDNLKLGYGGTKEEMLRLVNDSGVLNKTVSSLDEVSFDQIIMAIHKVQENMGITGTTAKEAATTISGSIASMKSAWDNFLNGSGDMSTLVATAQTAVTNIANAVSTLIPQIFEQVNNSMPQILETINSVLDQIMGIIADNLPNLLNVVTSILQQLLQALLNIAPQLLSCVIQVINQLTQFILSNLPQIISVVMQLLTQIIQAITDFIPELVAMLPTLIQGIVDGILSNLGPLLEAGLQLLLALAQRNCSSNTSTGANDTKNY